MTAINELRPLLQQARQRSRARGEAVLDHLLATSGLGVEALADALAREAGVVALWAAKQATPDFSRIGKSEARTLGAVPLRREDGSTCLGAADPWDDGLVRRATVALGMVPVLAAATSALLSTWLAEDRDAIAPASSVTAEGAHRPAAQGPVVDFVDEAIRTAFEQGASDVHFECDRAGVSVKLRLDGVLVRHARLADVARAEEVISRIKVMAQLDITERRTPQDGRFRFDLGDAHLDLRVSIMPSVHGEDAVLRLLDKAQLRSRDEQVTLDLLGFGDDSAERIRDLGGLPHGMLLVTGPTGSGKTTTVYAVLSEVNTGLEKIITIEDPVEYELPGVLQIPVNERKGLSFAKGLRSILRHDPDRILVGEIRDAETAEIAVQSALTGHQVFTTLHANSIFDVTGRFRHFGLDMFGFMASLNGVIVQRLLRRTCPLCVASRPVTEKERRWMASAGAGGWSSVPLAVGCLQCRGTGYMGRSVLAEVHAVDDGLRDLVTGQAPVSALREHVMASGVVSLSSLAAAMVMQGRTTLEEVRRVVG